MPNQKNKDLLEKAKDKIKKAQAVYVVNYQGLTHKQLEEARVLFKDADSELSIIKNNLSEIAFREEKKIDLSAKLFGPTAMLFSYKDPVKTAKILSVFFKKYNLPKINFGVFEGDIVDEQTILKIASIPGREVLLSKLVGLLNSPMTGLVYSLNYSISKLVFVLKAVEKKKQVS